MTPALLFPVALGAVAAVLVPLVIHIARSSETRTIDFAALRWLHPSPRPVRRLRLDEPGLLAVRVLLLVALALFLAKPVLGGLGRREPVVAVSPRVAAMALPDLVGHRVWLAPGFPGIEQPAPAASGDTSSLIRQLDAETPAQTPISIIVPSTLSGVDAERPTLSRPVGWRIAPSARPERPPARHTPPFLVVRYAPDQEDSGRYFRAVAVAWADQGKPPALEIAAADRPLPGKASYLVWLSGAPLPAEALDWIEDGGVVLLQYDSPSPAEGARRPVWRDADGEVLATEGRFGQGRVLQLTCPLQPSAMPQLVEPDFPDILSAMLAPPPPPAVVAAVDHAPSVGAPRYPRSPLDLQPWLAVLIALIFAGERWLATRPARTVAP